MARVIKLDKFAHEEPYTIRNVDNDGKPIDLENGVFTCMTKEKDDYDISLAKVEGTDGLPVLHATAPKIKPGVVNLEAEFVAKAGTNARGFLVREGQEFTVTLDVESDVIKDPHGQFTGGVEDDQTISVAGYTIVLEYIGMDIVELEVGYTYRVKVVEKTAKTA